MSKSVSFMSVAKAKPDVNTKMVAKKVGKAKETKETQKVTEFQKNKPPQKVKELPKIKDVVTTKSTKAVPDVSKELTSKASTVVNLPSTVLPKINIILNNQVSSLQKSLSAFPQCNSKSFESIVSQAFSMSTAPFSYQTSVKICEALYQIVYSATIYQISSFSNLSWTTDDLKQAFSWMDFVENFIISFIPINFVPTVSCRPLPFILYQSLILAQETSFCREALHGILINYSLDFFRNIFTHFIEALLQNPELTHHEFTYISLVIEKKQNISASSAFTKIYDKVKQRNALLSIESDLLSDAFTAGVGRSILSKFVIRDVYFSFYYA